MANIILPQAKVLDAISDSATMLVEENGEIRRYNVTSLTEDFVSQVDNKPKAGFIYPLASATVPNGFLLCDGAAYSRSEYPELFAAIGTIYGSGDGSMTFNVPNLATRVPVGKGNGYALGATGGEATHALTVSEMPSHSHNLYDPVVAPGASGGGVAGMEWNTDSYDWGTRFTVATGGSKAHNNMQPYTVVNYIIATGKNTGVSVQDVIAGAQAIPLGIEYGGTGATNAATARQNLGITPENIGAMSMELLWKNGHPDSAFPAQFVGVPEHDCEFYLVIAAVSGRTEVSLICPAFGTGLLNAVYGTTGPGSGGMMIKNRGFNAVRTGIDFGGCYYTSISASGWISIDNSLVPTHIYGLKGVAA